MNVSLATRLTWWLVEVSFYTFSDSSFECSLSIEENGNQALLGPMKPFAMDLDVDSNRSSVISQEESDDVQQP